MNSFGNAQNIANGTSLEYIAPGAHVCSTCESEDESIENAVLFLAQGLERGDKCVHIGGEDTQSLIVQRLIDRGVDVVRTRETHGLMLITPKHAGLRGDRTDVYRMFTFWKKMTAAAAREKFRTLRGVSQMTWLPTDVTTSEQLQAYEERLTQLVEDTGCVLLCQYDPRFQPAAFMLDGLCTHAQLVDRGELCRNVFCMADRQTQAATVEERALELLLHSLRVHEQFRRELVGTRADLARLARIITLGELTASVAHEVTQPVTAMMTDGNAALRWLTRTPPHLEEARMCLARIVAGAYRAEGVIQRIRSLVTKADTTKELLSVNDVIIEAAALMHHQLQEANIVLRTELAMSLPRTWADRVQIQQVVFNLIVNALEAINAQTGDKREIIIRTAHDLKYLTVSVTDSGIGLGTEQAQFVMKPFYTTKPHGMGIGLSISSRIIEWHDGELWTERNEDGVGATFYFTLPLPAHQAPQ